MKRSFGLVAACMLTLPAWTADPPNAPPLGPAIDKLTTSVDRLAGLLERELALRVEDRDARRVEVAVGVMGLRYRKIDRLEADIQQGTREEEEAAGHLELMKADIDRIARQGRAASGEMLPEAKAEIEIFELRVRSEEDRVARLRERRQVLLNDLTAERRRLAHVEALLDAWMGKQ